MLSLIAHSNEIEHGNTIERGHLAASMCDIVKELRQTAHKVNIIGDAELQYLTSMALESAREKMLLQIYQNS
jgi:methyl coenzyme M reductase subunit C-like uncharacterized protein (methanogenesis marker protein 7)